MNENKYILQLKELVLTNLTDEPVQVFLYGSRARGDEHYTSDVDIGYVPKGKFDENKIIALKEKIEQSSIPYKVDVVNLTQTSDAFRQEVLKDAEIWKD